MDMKEVLKAASLEAQGHTGTAQNFDPLDESERDSQRDKNANKYRIALDLRTLIAAVILFAGVAAAGIYFAYTASANVISETGANNTSANVVKRSENPTENQTNEASPALQCPELPTSPAVPITPEKGVDATGKVNLNLATLEDLQTLKGVGPATAQRILDWRTENGKFTRIEDLMEVKGIGQATFDKLKDKLKV